MRPPDGVVPLNILQNLYPLRIHYTVSIMHRGGGLLSGLVVWSIPGAASTEQQIAVRHKVGSGGYPGATGAS